MKDEKENLSSGHSTERRDFLKKLAGLTAYIAPMIISLDKRPSLAQSVNTNPAVSLRVPVSVAAKG